MKSIKNSILLLILVFSISNCKAQIKNIKIETVKIDGNCGICKKNIETASHKKHISKAVWNETNKTAVITYDSLKTTAYEVLKQIAYAGYDNQYFLAPDAAYNKLDLCCQYERKRKKEEKKIGIQVDTILKNSTTIKLENINPLSKVYMAYFELKDALANDNGTRAVSKANILYNAILEVPMQNLLGEKHTVWMLYEKKILLDAAHIKEVSKLEHQREYFISLSKNIFELLKVIKYEATVYYDYCPMANNGKGANWLSLQQPIFNPYMGKAMQTCGKIQETIK